MEANELKTLSDSKKEAKLTGIRHALRKCGCDSVDVIAEIDHLEQMLRTIWTRVKLIEVAGEGISEMVDIPTWDVVGLDDIIHAEILIRGVLDTVITSQIKLVLKIPDFIQAISFLASTSAFCIENASLPHKCFYSDAASSKNKQECEVCGGLDECPHIHESFDL
jgi:hypothetical protein